MSLFSGAPLVKNRGLIVIDGSINIVDQVLEKDIHNETNARQGKVRSEEDTVRTIFELTFYNI